MRDPFARATSSVRRLLGTDALLRGAPAGKVHIEHGVEVYEQVGDHDAAFSRSIATIDKTKSPKQGDSLQMLDENGLVTASYIVGRFFADNGYNVRYLVSEV